MKSESIKAAKKRNLHDGLINLPSLVVSGTKMKKIFYKAFMFRPKLYKSVTQDTKVFK